ncbi:helix-turn-helix transcriptional regulator [Fusibacter sp. 3D3]|uniref:helix-turn-helix transcriptional regulator n=1 Tax=Fusibacter sp. 3D3 TaxID=1048380 RepID=UPI0008536ACD|nr:response regulator transcription factor [Fusibacter sp. 3D3]GAU75537.1 transcriptional regulator [Fusibacter sp. 3D3]
MQRIKNMKACLRAHAEDNAYIVETLKRKYGNIDIYDRKKDINYIRFPYDYFVDLKFFLGRQNAPAVRTLLVVIYEIPLKKIVGKSDLREFKNALIVFMTLFLNVMIEVYGNRENQIVNFSNVIAKIEDNDGCEVLKTLVLDEMAEMIRNQNEIKSSVRHGILVQEALTIIQRQFRRKISLKSLAQELSISESYLSRCLKQETGKTLSEHVLKLRIDEARQLLIKTDASVYDISIAVGFNYQNHFASVFKKYAGIAPLEYRNRHHQ